ncbi:hypothetical protein DFJ74DRAFT_687865 [Hyaloraphidium curvatum]|nr:hypothetical protein DFJ74DRAFT_687865 [Hyaloraphidium curvatum]
MSACACYCSGPSWSNYFAGYFDLSRGSCTQSNCIYYFPSYCLPGYTIVPTYYNPPSGGLSTGGSVAIAVMCGVAAVLLLGVACYFFKKSADKKKAAALAAQQQAVVQMDVYKSDGAYPATEQPQMPGAGGYYDPNAAAYPPPPEGGYQAPGYGDASAAAGGYSAPPTTGYQPPATGYQPPPTDATSYQPPATTSYPPPPTDGATTSYPPPPTNYDNAGASGSYAPPSYDTVPAATVAPEKSKPPGS